mmetsp:Transcript_65593/g.154954  ORF Transcript_65593/g.154954 Transcript_65593/m.154954 type:complete len:94 (+) Transcript_65593:375-656(+)
MYVDVSDYEASHRVLEFLRLKKPLGTRKDPTPTCPVLFLYGKRGGLGGMWKWWTASFAARTDGSSFYGLECGHWVMLEKPDEVNQHMDKFLSK